MAKKGIERGYKIKVETTEGDTKIYNRVHDYFHRENGLILVYEDKSEVLISKLLIQRLWIGPMDEGMESDGDIEINS